MIDYESYKIGEKEAIKWLGIGYSVLFVISYLFYKSLIFSFLAGFFLVFLVKPYKRYRIDQRKAAVRDQFKDMLVSLDSSLAAGRNMVAAFQEARDNLSLIHGESALLVQELTYFLRDVMENRNGVEQLLIDWAGRCAIEDVRNFVDVYVTCRRTGGDLASLVRECLAIISEKMSIEKEIRTMMAHRQLEGRIIALMPIGVIGFLNVFSPAYLQVMYTTLSGRIIMTGALATMTAALVWTYKLTKLEV